MIAPALEEIAGALDGKVKIVNSTLIKIEALWSNTT